MKRIEEEEENWKLFSVAYLKVVSVFNSVFAAGLEMGTSFWVHPRTTMYVYGISYQENVSRSIDFHHQYWRWTEMMSSRSVLLIAFHNLQKMYRYYKALHYFLIPVSSLCHFYLSSFLISSKYESGFGGLEVSVLAFGTQVQTRPKPSDFSGENILSAPSFGGEVKPSFPCRKFTACKRTEEWHGSRHFQHNSRQFLAHSSTFRCWGSLALFQSWGTSGGGSWNVLITGPPSWGVWRAAGNATL